MMFNFLDFIFETVPNFIFETVPNAVEKTIENITKGLDDV